MLDWELCQICYPLEIKLLLLLLYPDHLDVPNHACIKSYTHSKTHAFKVFHAAA